MAKVRVRALVRGFDGQCRRSPGEEFDFDVDHNGMSKWFELVDSGKSPITESQEKDTDNSDKPKSGKKSGGKKSADDLLA